MFFFVFFMDLEENLANLRSELEEQLLEFGELISIPADRRYIENFIECTESLGKAECVFVYSKNQDLADGRGGGSKTLVFSEIHRMVLDKIRKQAEYFNENDDVKYNIDGDFIEGFQLTERLQLLISSGVLPFDVKKFSFSIIEQLSRDKVLSVAQLTYVESILRGPDGKKDSGDVYLNPLGSDIVKNYSTRIVNYGLGRGRVGNYLRGDEFLDFRRRYIEEDPGLKRLEQEILGLIKGNSFEKKRLVENYGYAFKALRFYLSNVDLERHSFEESWHIARAK